jgi:hypothetical protein
MGLFNLSFNRIPKDRDLFSDGDSSKKAALAFVHIPKTAGTWFTQFLAQHFPPHEIATPIYKAPDSMDFSDPSKRFFAAHFHNWAINTKRDIRLVTFLRDPVERTASHYRTWHHKGNFGEFWKANASAKVAEAVQLVQGYSYEEFVLSDNPTVQDCIRDVQTSFLTSHPDPSHPNYFRSALRNLEKTFFFVGLQEFSAESLQLFSYQTGSTLKPQYPTLNISTHYDVTLSKPARQRLLDLLQNDLEIYRAGQRLFEKRMAAISRRLKKVA